MKMQHVQYVTIHINHDDPFIVDSLSDALNVNHQSIKITLHFGKLYCLEIKLKNNWRLLLHEDGYAHWNSNDINEFVYIMNKTGFESFTYFNELYYRSHHIMPGNDFEFFCYMQMNAKTKEIYEHFMNRNKFK